MGYFAVVLGSYLGRLISISALYFRSHLEPWDNFLKAQKYENYTKWTNSNACLGPPWQLEPEADCSLSCLSWVLLLIVHHCARTLVCVCVCAHAPERAYACVCDLYLSVFICEYVCMLYVCVCIYKFYVSMCVYACAFMCVYVSCVYVCVCLCMCVYVNVCELYECVCMYMWGVCVSVYMCISACVYTCVYACMCMCTCVCMYVCVYACVCACMYVYVSVCVTHKYPKHCFVHSRWICLSRLPNLQNKGSRLMLACSMFWGTTACFVDFSFWS